MPGRTPQIYRINQLDLNAVNLVLQQIQTDMNAALATNQSLNAKGRPIKNVGAPTTATDAVRNTDIPVVATTVASSTSSGERAVVGTGIKYAREDHSHGTPSAQDLSVIWPVGSVFYTATNVNPDTLLEFGTWTLMGSISAPYAWQRVS